MLPFKIASTDVEKKLLLKEKIDKMISECALLLKQRGEDEASFLEEIQKVKIDVGTL